MSLVTIGRVSGESSNDLLTFWLSTHAHLKNIGIGHYSFPSKEENIQRCRNFKISIHERYIHVEICNVYLKGPAIGQSVQSDNKPLKRSLEVTLSTVAR